MRLVKITETLERIIAVDCETDIDALDFVESLYDSESIVLDSSDHVSTSFQNYSES